MNIDMESWVNDKISTLLKIIELTDLRYEQRFQSLQLAAQNANSEQQKAIDAALLAADRAVSKSEVATEKRFESVNEFRAQLSDQVATFISRSEYALSHTALSEKMEAITQRQEIKSNEIKDQISGLIPRLEFVGIISSINEKVNSSLERIDEKLNISIARLDITQGKVVGAAASRDIIMAAAVIVSIVVSIVLHFI